jgi:hypothetical protein
MQINQVHEIIGFHLNKTQGGYFSPQEIDRVLDVAQMAYFNDLYNNPRKFRPDKQSPVMGYGESQRIDDALSPFKKNYTFTNGDTPSGVISLPNDYMFLISLYTSVFNNNLQRSVINPVEVLNEEELVSRLESQVCPVSLTGPICVMNSNNKIQLFPDVPQSGRVYYFKRPNAPVYSFTLNGRVVQYNASGSTQLEWRDSEINNIISIALGYLGINMKSEEIIQFGEIKNQQGQ